MDAGSGFSIGGCAGLGRHGQGYQGREANGIGHTARLLGGRYANRVSRPVWATEEKKLAVPNLTSHRRERPFYLGLMAIDARRQGRGGSGALGRSAVIAISRQARHLGEVGIIKVGVSAFSVSSISSKKRGIG